MSSLVSPKKGLGQEIIIASSSLAGPSCQKKTPDDDDKKTQKIFRKLKKILTSQDEEKSEINTSRRKEKRANRAFKPVARPRLERAQSFAASLSPALKQMPRARRRSHSTISASDAKAPDLQAQKVEKASGKVLKAKGATQAFPPVISQTDLRMRSRTVASKFVPPSSRSPRQEKEEKEAPRRERSCSIDSIASSTSTVSKVSLL